MANPYKLHHSKPSREDPFVKWYCWIWVIVISLGFVGCSSPQASQSFQLQNIVWEEDFSDTDYVRFARHDRQGFRALVQNGNYVIRSNIQAYVRVQDDEQHEDVVVEADLFQLSSDRQNAYGIMCRANSQDNGRGYYFLITADGYYSIRVGRGREVASLVAWEYSDIIHQDARRNTIRVVCIGNYLALYVNGTFLAEARDDLYHRGSVGLVTALSSPGEIEIAFDGIRAWEASIP